VGVQRPEPGHEHMSGHFFERLTPGRVCEHAVGGELTGAVCPVEVVDRGGHGLPFRGSSAMASVIGSPVAYSVNWYWPPDPLHFKNQWRPEVSTQKSKCPNLIPKLLMKAGTALAISGGMSTTS